MFRSGVNMPLCLSKASLPKSNCAGSGKTLSVASAGTFTPAERCAPASRDFPAEVCAAVAAARGVSPGLAEHVVSAGGAQGFRRPPACPGMRAAPLPIARRQRVCGCLLGRCCPACD